MRRIKVAIASACPWLPRFTRAYELRTPDQRTANIRHANAATLPAGSKAELLPERQPAGCVPPFGFSRITISVGSRKSTGCVGESRAAYDDQIGDEAFRLHRRAQTKRITFGIVFAPKSATVL